MASAPKSLKSQNMPWLCAAVTFDVLLLIALLTDANGDWFSKANATRLGLSAFVPVAVLLLANALPTGFKETLSFWRLKEVLPGHRAFTKYGPEDSRIDMAALQKSVGALPETAKEQNALWYKLYKAVGEQTSILESHKTYLFLRELTAISFALLVAIPGILIFLKPEVAVVGALLLLVQFLLSSLGARNSGIRFVNNVLVVHAAGKAVASPAKKKKPVEEAK